MRVPVSWIREFAAVPAEESGRNIADKLISVGLEVESVDVFGADVTGPLVVGRVQQIEELTEFKKPIRFCQVAVGANHGHPDTPGIREIICGARNFAEGDLVVVALPGAVLPGGFAIGTRQTYGKTSDGMICADRELGIGDDGAGIMVLPPDSAEVGDAAIALLGIGDQVLDIAVTPDRGYALSVRGVAREAATAYQVAFRDPGAELADLPAPATGTPIACQVSDTAGCELFTLRTLTGFDPSRPTPLWLRNRLVACGMRSVNLAVDITNYVMLELGQPLHAFDAETLTGSVDVRSPEPGTKFETLDHVERSLVADDLVVADDSGPIALAGTMGGVATEVTETTTSLALEAAYFAPTRVARMARRYKLSSEASRRFERGIDRMIAPVASARAAALLLELGGGEYVGMTAAEMPYLPPTITISSDLPGQVTGMEIPDNTTRSWLQAVGCQIEGTESLQVTPPSWRPDLTDPADLVEEVARLVGYDQIPAELPPLVPHDGWSQERLLTRRVGLYLAARGFTEVPSYPFCGDSDWDRLQLPADDPRRRAVRLANPLSDKEPYLRTTLLTGLAATALLNRSRGTESAALYEIGPVFQSKDSGPPPRPDVAQKPDSTELAGLDAALPEQPVQVGALICGDVQPSGWWGSERRGSWADAVQTARLIGAALRLELNVAPTEHMPFHPGRGAQIELGGRVVGYAGELHPRVIAATGLPNRSAALELNLSALFDQVADTVPAPQFSTMPVAKEDIALIVPEEFSAEQVSASLTAGAGPLLESLRIFDEYRGEQVGDGRRSLAYSLRFRAPDRTLTAEEVVAARTAAVAEAARVCKAVLRDS